MKPISKRDDGRYSRVPRSKEAARVVIHRGADMNASGRRRIASWLRREAAFLERHADRMASRYTARWLYS